MVLMMVAGAVSLIFGVVFIFFPQQLNRWSELASRQLNQLDPTIRNNRLGTGISLLAVGIFCIASAYYVWLRLR